MVDVSSRGQATPDYPRVHYLLHSLLWKIWPSHRSLLNVKLALFFSIYLCHDIAGDGSTCLVNLCIQVPDNIPP